MHPQTMELSSDSTAEAILRELASESETSLRSIRRCLAIRAAYPDLFVRVLEGMTMKEAFRQKSNRDNPFAARMREHEDPTYRPYVSGGENARNGDLLRIFWADTERMEIAGFFYGIAELLDEDIGPQDIRDMHARYVEIAEPLGLELPASERDYWDRLIYQMVRCLLLDIEAGLQFRDDRLAENRKSKGDHVSAFGMKIVVCPRFGLRSHLSHVASRMRDMAIALRISSSAVSRLRVRHVLLTHPDKVNLTGLSDVVRGYWALIIFKPMAAALTEIARALDEQEAHPKLPMPSRWVYPEYSEDVMRLVLFRWEQANAMRLDELSRQRREKAEADDEK